MAPAMNRPSRKFWRRRRRDPDPAAVGRLSVLATRARAIANPANHCDTDGDANKGVTDADPAKRAAGAEYVAPEPTRKVADVRIVDHPQGYRQSYHTCARQGHDTPIHPVAPSPDAGVTILSLKPAAFAFWYGRS